MSVLVSKTSTATIGALAPTEVIITHADDSIRIGDGTNLAGVTPAGELKVSGTFSADVTAEDPNGDPQPLLVDSNGALLVNTSGSFAVQDVKVLFNEVSGISIGIETTINTYTAPSGKISYLLSILNAGENRAQYNVYLNSVLLDKQYTNVTQLLAMFDYKTGSSSTPGMVVPVGQTVVTKVVNSGTASASFNSRYLILEVT